MTSFLKFDYRDSREWLDRGTVATITMMAVVAMGALALWVFSEPVARLLLAIVAVIGAAGWAFWHTYHAVRRKGGWYPTLTHAAIMALTIALLALVYHQQGWYGIGAIVALALLTMGVGRLLVKYN